METRYLAWTIENWITVVLMAALGYLLFALAAQGLHYGMGSQPS